MRWMWVDGTIRRILARSQDHGSWISFADWKFMSAVSAVWKEVHPPSPMPEFTSSVSHVHGQSLAISDLSFQHAPGAVSTQNCLCSTFPSVHDAISHGRPAEIRQEAEESFRGDSVSLDFYFRARQPNDQRGTATRSLVNNSVSHGPRHRSPQCVGVILRRAARRIMLVPHEWTLSYSRGSVVVVAILSTHSSHTWYWNSTKCAGSFLWLWGHGAFFFFFFTLRRIVDVRRSAKHQLLRCHFERVEAPFSQSEYGDYSEIRDSSEYSCAASDTSQRSMRFRVWREELKCADDVQYTILFAFLFSCAARHPADSDGRYHGIRYTFRTELLSCLVLSCLVLSCLVLSCLVLSCLVLSCLVLSWSCLVLSCLVLSCLVLSCLVLSCLVLSCLVLSCLVLSCLVLSCLVLSCLVLSCLVLSCLVLSCLVLSCLVLSCLVLSCLVLSCLVLSCLVLSCLVLLHVNGSSFILSGCHSPVEHKQQTRVRTSIALHQFAPSPHVVVGRICWKQNVRCRSEGCQLKFETTFKDWLRLGIGWVWKCQCQLFVQLSRNTETFHENPTNDRFTIGFMDNLWETWRKHEDVTSLFVLSRQMTTKWEKSHTLMTRRDSHEVDRDTCKINWMNITCYHRTFIPNTLNWRR